MKVAILTGPESAGKSSLCRALAQRFAAPVVAEYVREYIQQQKRDTCYADVEPIAREQWRREQVARNQPAPLLLLDTHLLSNRLWSQTLFGSSPAWLDQVLAQQRYDAVFLLDPQGLPWLADGQRCQPQLHQRQAFHAQLRDGLAPHQAVLHDIAGDWQQRYQQIEALLLALLKK